jgi:DNA replication and repair protein RecF
MSVQGIFSHNKKDENIFCGVKKGKKKIFKRNDKEYQKLSEHIGLFPVVMVSPMDMNLILEGSEERRKFMNNVISQYNRQYLEDIINYNRILQQRNKLLKEMNSKNRIQNELIDVYDEQLVEYGLKIYRERAYFIKKFIPKFRDYYQAISSEREEVELVYQSQLEEDNFKMLLKDSLQKDLVLQYTSVGIHKDDLLFNLSGYNIKKFGSQGQQKTYLVALKMAKYEFIKELNKVEPILLLDDIFDKFDRERVQQIIKLVSDNHFGQIFITHTNEDRIRDVIKGIASNYKIFGVVNNSVKELLNA